MIYPCSINYFCNVFTYVSLVPHHKATSNQLKQKSYVKYLSIIFHIDRGLYLYFCMIAAISGIKPPNYVPVWSEKFVGCVIRLDRVSYKCSTKFILGLKRICRLFILSLKKAENRVFRERFRKKVNSLNPAATGALTRLGF